MGALLSAKSNERDPEYYNIFEMGDADFSVLDDLLIDILVNVSSTDLLQNCRVVCKSWKELIDGHSIWKLKCEKEKKLIPSIKFSNKLPDHFYRQIYIHDPYQRNFIKNACGEDLFRDWEDDNNSIDESNGDWFLIENPPAGADAVPSEVGSQSCFATTFFPCVKHQIINLLREGVSRDVLQMKTTKIQISEWYAARFDCASEYSLTVLLLSEDCDIDDRDSYDLFKLDEFNFSFHEEQWAGREWHKVSHEFVNVGGVRYVFFQHQGKDRQFWAGHYGSKMTGASVKIIV